MKTYLTIVIAYMMIQINKRIYKEIESRLKEALSTIKENYDYIFIDCPPSLGLLTINLLDLISGI